MQLRKIKKKVIDIEIELGCVSMSGNLGVTSFFVCTTVSGTGTSHGLHCRMKRNDCRGDQRKNPARLQELFNTTQRISRAGGGWEEGLGFTNKDFLSHSFLQGSFWPPNKLY